MVIFLYSKLDKMFKPISCYNKLMLSIPGVKTKVSLAEYTTYKIGGHADYFFVAHSQNELKHAIVQARKNNIPYFVLGIGANILFGDKGFRGLVIKNESKNFTFKDNILSVESGATIENLISVSAERNLSGFEHFAGIPSTVGGALWQNLHFLSPDRLRTVFIEEIFVNAKVLTSDNKVIVLDKHYFNFGYDHSILHEINFIVLEATFNLTLLSEGEILKQAEENIAWRKSKQPQLSEYPSCGSVFKKIDGVGAGRLIEQVGLKGSSIGSIQSSFHHANFLVNTGGGTAAEVRLLIEMIQDKVEKDTGYKLETEIGFIGEF